METWDLLTKDIRRAILTIVEAVQVRWPPDPSLATQSTLTGTLTTSSRQSRKDFPVCRIPIVSKA